MLAPRGTPAPIIARINHEVVEILRDPVFREQMVTAGFDPVEGENTPQQWRALLVGEVETRSCRLANFSGETGYGKSTAEAQSVLRMRIRDIALSRPRFPQMLYDCQGNRLPMAGSGDAGLSW